MRTGISFPSLLSLPLGLPPRPSTHNTRNLAFFFAAFHGAQVAVPQRPSRYRRGWRSRELKARGAGEGGGGGSRAVAERAVTFVTFSLLRFSSWFAFQSHSYSPPYSPSIPPSSLLSLSLLCSNHRRCWMLHFSLPLDHRRNSFIRASPRVAFPKTT